MSETRNYLKPVHTSFETAFEQDGYPYGRRGRCLRRVWVEQKNGHGMRFVYCTSPVYYPDEGQTAELVRNRKWNKPHASTYCSGMILLYLDENEHVQQDAITLHSGPEAFAGFEERTRGFLSDEQAKDLPLLRKIAARMNSDFAKYDAAKVAQPTPAATG